MITQWHQNNLHSHFTFCVSEYYKDSAESQCIFPVYTVGGTDIISCFAGQNPTVPVYRGEIQSRNLGMAMECWDDNGKHMKCG